MFAADGIEPLEVSAPAVMRGGADVAVGDTALSQIENPASLGLHNDHRVDFTGQVVHPDNHWSGPIDSADNDMPLCYVLNLAYSEPIKDGWSWGTAVHSKEGLGIRYRMKHLMNPFLERTVNSDIKDISIPFNLGYRVNKKLTVGAGVRAEMATTEFRSIFGLADVTFERGYAEGVGFQTGLTYKPRKDVTLGLAYRSPSWFTDMEGGDFKTSLFGVLPMDLGKAKIENFRLPQKISTGAAWDVTDRWKLVGETRWVNNADTTLNTANIVADGLIDVKCPLAIGYRDQWVFIAGTEYKLTKHWIAAAGYNYATNPLHRQNLLPITSILPQHHITVGLRYVQDHWWVGGGYALGLRNHLTGNGDSHIPFGVDYAFSELTQTQHFAFVGFGFSW